jgi:hypothetical protein
VRRILLHAGVFALIAGVIVLVKLAPWEREPTAQEKLADAEERWQEVRGVEKKIEEGAASLSREDRAALGRALRAFVATSDATHARLDALQVRKEGAGKEAADLGRKLLELKLRVLDTEAVLEASREGAGGADRPPLAAAGFFVPLQGAVARERQAEADLKSVEAPGAQGAGAGERRSRAAAVQQALEQCLTDYRGLGVRVREGLTREDLGPSHLPFVATLEAEEKRASEALRRVEELLR